MLEVNNSVIKAIKILELFKDNEALTIADIYDKTGYSKSAINRILSSFVSLGYINKDETNAQFRLSNKLYALGISTNVNNNIVEIAKPHIELLAKELEITVSLSIMDNYRSFLFYQRNIKSGIQITPPVGNSGGLNCVASGKVLVAFSRDMEKIIDVMEFEKRTPNSIMDKDVYRDLMIKTREIGYAYEDEEIELGLFCLAAPVLDREGYCICSISLSGYRKILIDNFDRNKDALLQCVRNISRDYIANHG